MKDKFKTKNGWLTVYALACGYVEEFDNGKARLTIELNGGFQVKWYPYVQQGKMAWERFDTIVEARKCFKQYKKEMQ